MNTPNGNGQRQQGVPLPGASTAASSGAASRPAALPPSRVPNYSLPSHLPPQSGPVRMGAPLGSNNPGAVLFPHATIPMPAYLGASAAMSALSTQGPSPGALSLANSPFQRLNAQNGAGGPSAALFPHLQWHMSRAPSDSPTPAVVPARTTAPASTPSASTSRPATAQTSSLPTIAVTSPGGTVPVAVKLEPEDTAVSESSSRPVAASESSSSSKQKQDKQASSGRPGIEPLEVSSGEDIVRPPSLPTYCKPTHVAGEELDAFFPDLPVVKKPLTSYKHLHIVASKSLHYKLSRFDPFEFADADQSDAFWMPKNSVHSRLVKEWREGRAERLRVKNEWLAETEAIRKEEEEEDEEERKKEEEEEARKEKKRKASLPSTSNDADSGSTSKRQRLSGRDSVSPNTTTTATPAAAAAADKNKEPEKRTLPSSSTSQQSRPRGRPKGSKNKVSDKPRGSLLKLPPSIANGGPQEVDEVDELEDDDDDDVDLTVDMSVLQPSAAARRQDAPPEAPPAREEERDEIRQEEREDRQEELEQEALIAKVLTRPERIVNPTKVKTEAFLEIPAARSPRYTPVVQKVLKAATGIDDTVIDRVIETERDSASPSPAVIPNKPGPKQSRGRPRKIVEDDTLADSSDSRPSPAPTSVATSSKPTTRGTRGGPASRVRAVTEAEFKGLLGPRTGSSLEPTPPPNGRALRSAAQNRAGRDGSDDTPQARERDASSPVEEFLSQPQAIISAQELARRAVPRVGGWIVPIAPPRSGAGPSSRGPSILQIATSPHGPSAGEASRGQRQQSATDKFAVVVPVRAGPPQGEFGREEQLTDAYMQLRDRHADSGTIRTPQDLAQALQQSGVLQPGSSSASTVATVVPVLGSSVAQPIVAVPSIMAPPVVGTPAVGFQPVQYAGPIIPAPVLPSSATAATARLPMASPRPSAGVPLKPLAVADLEKRMLRSPAIPSFLKTEIRILLQALSLQADPRASGDYTVNIDPATIPQLASKDVWWFDLDLGKVQDGGNGYTVILNLELAQRTFTTHGMSRALVKQVHTIPAISPWYDSFGRRRLNDGSLMPDEKRVEGGAQTESLEDAQSIAVVEYQNELVKLKGELEKVRGELVAEGVSKREIEEQNEFLQRQYDQASTRAVELSREVTTLETQVSTLKRQLNDGLAAHRLFSNAASERYQADLRELRTENKLLKAQAANTDNEVRRRAAEYDTLRALEVVRLREREKAFRAQGGVGPYIQPAAAPAPAPAPMRIMQQQQEFVPMQGGSSSSLPMQGLQMGSNPAHSLTPPSVAAGLTTLPNGTLLGAGSSQLGATQAGSQMDISGDLNSVGFADLAQATQAAHFL
ncbi:hypothetical protein CF319_g5418 [Tilletia indica]|nr:hypothetical protein CF319_g5418 [Tilletia indica]